MSGYIASRSIAISEALSAREDCARLYTSACAKINGVNFLYCLLLFAMHGLAFGSATSCLQVLAVYVSELIPLPRQHTRCA